MAHAREKRPIAKYYSMNGVLSLEPHIDKMIGYLCKKLEEEFIDKPEAEKSCDLGQWLLFCELFFFLPICMIGRLSPRRTSNGS